MIPHILWKNVLKVLYYGLGIDETAHVAYGGERKAYPPSPHTHTVKKKQQVAQTNSLNKTTHPLINTT